MKLFLFVFVDDNLVEMLSLKRVEIFMFIFEKIDCLNIFGSFEMNIFG